MIRYTPKRPCPVCGKGSKGCSVTDDGLHSCRGEARDRWFKVGEDEHGFSHYRHDDDQPSKPAKTTNSKPIDWPAMAEQFANDIQQKPDLFIRLAEVLRVPREVFPEFALGVRKITSDSVEFTIPECDGEEQIVGIATRIEKREGKTEKNR